MPKVLPPADCPSPSGPAITRLPAGSTWWRIHGDDQEGSAFRIAGAVDKRDDPIRHGNEGRFDCQNGEYGYLYLAETKRAAIAEAFLRGSVVSDPASRFLRRATLRDRVLSQVKFTTDLVVVDLRGVGLGRVGQDAWLTSCDETDYVVTQEWATALRRWAPTAMGLAWLSKRDNDHRSLILFSDRMPDGVLDSKVTRRLDDPLGAGLVAKTISQFGIALR